MAAPRRPRPTSARPVRPHVRDELCRRLTAGEWLLINQVAAVLRVSRATVDRMLRADPPTLRWRPRPGTGSYREVNPEDVTRELTRRDTMNG